MSTNGSIKGIVFSLVLSLIKGFGAKAIGIVVKGLILGLIFSLVLTPLIFAWGEFSYLRFFISVVFFFAGIAGIVAYYVLHKAPGIIDPSIDQTIANNYGYIQSKVGGISSNADPEKLFCSSKEFILDKFKFLSPFLSGVTYEVFSKYAGTAAKVGSNFSGAVNSSYSYLNALQQTKDDPKAYLITFLSPLKSLYRIPIDGIKGKIKLALILVPVLCLGARLWFNRDLVKSWFNSTPKTEVIKSDLKADIKKDGNAKAVVKKAEDAKTIDPKFLITNKSAGYFTVNDTIGKLPKLYGWKGKPSEWFYDNAIFKTVVYNDAIEVYYKFACDTAEATSKHKDKNKYIYSESDNITGYFCKDSIDKIHIYSPEFKTKEGIGVGSTFSDVKKAYPKLYSYYNENVEGIVDVYIAIKKYPNVRFCFSYGDDLLVDLDKQEGTNRLQLEDGSHFRPEAKIRNIEIDIRPEFF